MPSFESNRHYEECKFFTPDAHTRVPDLLMLISAVLQSLGSPEREWLQRSAAESSWYQRELRAVKTKEAMAKVIAGGVIAMCSFFVLPGILPLALLIAITLLEVMIAVIQAYVFAILTCVYLNDALHLH